MPLSSPPAAPQRGDRTTFAQRVDAFITWLINFVAELNIFSANLNSIAAGGAYAIPFNFTAYSEIGLPTGGNLYLLPSGAGSQKDSQTLYIDTTSASGANVSALLASFTQSTSANRGQIRIVKMGDPSKWAMYQLIAVVGGNQYYKSFQISPIDASSDVPFQGGGPVILSFQRTGDKGDAGTASCLKVSDRKSGAEGGAASVGWNTRTLNTVDTNTITGASLASNTVTLPAGTFDVFGRAPATQNIHKAALYNVTDSVYSLIGSNAQSSSSGASTDSIVVGRITLTSSKTFQLRHYVSSTTGAGTHFGFTSGSGQIDVYSELQFLKVA